MGMEIYVGRAEIKSTSVFQAKQLYIYLFWWLKENNYASSDDSEFPEKMYWEVRSQEGPKEFWIWWRPTKVIEGNQFWQRVINCDFHGVRMKSAEIMYKGQKIKVDTGKFEVLLQAKLEIDRGGAMKKHPILGPFFEMFWKRIYKKEIEMYRKEVLADMKTIQDISRKFFKIGELATKKEAFMPDKGYDEVEF